MLEFLGRLVGRGGAHGGPRARRRRTAPRSRLTIPSVVPQVPDIFRRLRALRDDLEYYVEQDGVVLLLAWDPTAPRVLEARKMMLRGDDTFDTRIMLDGFSILAMCDPHAVWSGELLRCAQNIVDKATPKLVEATHAARVLEADGTMNDLRGIAHLRDAYSSDSRSDHRILFRGKRSFSGASWRHRGGADFGAIDRANARRRQHDFAVAARLMQRFPNLSLLSSR